MQRLVFTYCKRCTVVRKLESNSLFYDYCECGSKVTTVSIPHLQFKFYEPFIMEYGFAKFMQTYIDSVKSLKEV